MSFESIILTCGLLLVLFVIVQTFMVYRFCCWLRKADQHSSNGTSPFVALILSVRGESDSLIDCLEALKDIDYPCFEIHIIIDNAGDISFDTINTWKARGLDRLIQVHTLTEISRFSSLKTSAVSQCIKSLGPHVQAVAILDADTIVHREWLNELITPLQDECVGIVTGNRWYDATEMTLGNQIRFLYNAWAVPGMHFMNTAWGGSMAMNRSVFSHPDFFKTFANTPTEETGAQTIRMKLGLKIVQRSNLMMAQRGTITLTGAFGFITRQLTWTRLHYREWIGVLLGPLFIYCVTVCLAFSAGVAAYFRNGSLFAMATFVFLAYWIVNWFLVAYLNRCVVAKMSTHQERPFPNTNWLHHVVIFLMIPIGFVAFVFALLTTQFSRKIRWSGIDYRIRPPYGIELVEYRPH
jgi:cellulose synthase/poly-beta-1,6-N-acetylglucosamine synthase-like glycosyltransferase